MWFAVYKDAKYMSVCICTYKIMYSYLFASIFCSFVVCFAFFKMDSQLKNVAIVCSFKMSGLLLYFCYSLFLALVSFIFYKFALQKI